MLCFTSCLVDFTDPLSAVLTNYILEMGFEGLNSVSSHQLTKD